MNSRRSLAVILLPGLMASPAPAASSALEEPVVVTAHRLNLPDAMLEYSAETGRIAIRDAETGEPHGFMYYIAYRVPSAGPRPIAFVWNGGPGSNSALLHFEAAGPKIWGQSKNSRPGVFTLTPNVDTWLTAMDLVFVDPIGTGFSRPAKAEYAEEFYGTVGDVASVTEFVRAWWRLYGAEDSPLLLIGESWGAGRAGSVGHALQQRGIPVHALVLISGGTGLNNDPVPAALAQALRIVDLSVTALHHGRLPEDLDRSAEAIRAAAEAWAREVYAPALERVAGLADAERDAIAAGLARFTGMPAAAIDRESLVISPRAYREGLLQDSDQTLQVFDMRQIADEDAPGTAAERPSPSEVIPYYLRHELGYLTALPYVGLEPLEQAYAPTGEHPPSVNARWNYATAEVTPEEVEAAVQEAIRHGGGPPQLGPPLPSAAEAVTLNPRLKVLVAAGRFDSLNSCAVNEERARRLEGALRKAYTFACYEGGHMMYRDAAARGELANDVRALAAAAE
jgi:carboxypeptidase C (cathepsin A)